MAPVYGMAATLPAEATRQLLDRLPRHAFRGIAVPGHVLAIDLGTSALKVALVSTAGKIVASEQEGARSTLLPGGGAEQDPQRLVGH